MKKEAGWRTARAAALEGERRSLPPHEASVEHRHEGKGAFQGKGKARVVEAMQT